MPHITKEEKEKNQELARRIWNTLDENERFGVKFGMFPANKMKEASTPGYDLHTVTVAMMHLTPEPA